MEDDGMEAKSLADRMARNMVKLKTATQQYDEEKIKVSGMLKAASSEKGISGRMDPIVDRMVQFLGLQAGCRFNVLHEHTAAFGRTSGIMGGNADSPDSSSDTDSDIGAEDEAYADDGFEWSPGGVPIQEVSAETAAKMNFLAAYKPRFKSLTRLMPREKPKHKEGFLNVRQEHKLMSSRNWAVLRGDVLSLYMNQTEPLLGMEPVKDIQIKNASEWEQKAPYGFVVEDGYHSTKDGFVRFYLRSDEDCELWLKACLRASCWDDGRSRMNILNTLKKVKGLAYSRGPRADSDEKRGKSERSRRSSAPQPSSAGSPPQRVVRTKTLGERLAAVTVVPSVAPDEMSAKRRPSANPFSPPPQQYQAAPPGRRQFAGGGLLPTPPSSPETKRNPFEDDDDTSDEDMPPNPSLNPFSSSYADSGTGTPEQRVSGFTPRPSSELLEHEHNQLIDDFLALSADGLVSFEKLCSWEEIKSAIDSDDITEEDISLAWTEIGGGSGLDQEKFVALVTNIEKHLER
jgi:hypothetical protein